MLAHHARKKKIQAANKKSKETESFGMGTLPRKIIKEKLSKAVQHPKVWLEVDLFVPRIPFFVKKWCSANFDIVHLPNEESNIS